MQRCVTDAAFRVIVGEGIPNFRRNAEFRARHLKNLQPLLLEVLVLCRDVGLLKVGRLSLDGTKVKASASRNKAMNCDRRDLESERLQHEIDAMLAQADGEVCDCKKQKDDVWDFSHIHHGISERREWLWDPRQLAVFEQYWHGKRSVCPAFWLRNANDR